MHHDHRPAGPGELRREHRAVQHELRGPGHQHPVLHAGRLALGAVRHHHRGVPGGHRGELAGGREPGTAPAGQPGPAHLRDQRLPLPPSQAAGRRPVPGCVPGQAGRARVARQEPRPIPASRCPGQQQAGGHRSAPSAGTARSGRAGPRSQDSRRAITAVADRRGAPPQHQRGPPDPQVVACRDRVAERGRPGQVRQPVHGPPGPVAQPLPDQAGDQDGAAEVDRQGAQADGQRPVRGRERQHGRGPADPDVRVEDRGDDVQPEEGDAEQRQRPVQLARREPEPAPGAEPGRHAGHHGRAERGKNREAAGPRDEPQRLRPAEHRAHRGPPAYTWLPAGTGTAAPAHGRPAVQVADPAVVPGQPGRQTRRGQPFLGPGARHDRRRAGRVGVRAGRRGHGRGAPRPVRGPPGPRVHDVVQLRAAAAPVPDGDRRRRDRARGQPDELPARRAAAVRVRLLGHGDRPAVPRRRPGHGDVAAQADQHAARRPIGGHDGPHGPVRAHALGGGTQVQPDAGRQPEQRPVQPHQMPARRGDRGSRGLTVLPDGREVAVVAE